MAETLNEKYKALVGDNTQNINTMYDASKTSALAGLESAYNQNLSDATAQKAQIDKQYNTAANDLGAQYERQRRNNNIQAAGNGLNVGTGSQMALAQASAYQRDMGNLRGQQAAAQTEQDRQINNIKMAYQSQVQQAIADNDLARATALTQEANRQIDQMTKAYQMQYNEEQDALDRQRQAELDAYNREQDAQAWQRTLDLDAYNRSQDEQAWNRQLALDAYNQEQTALDRQRQAELDAYNRSIDERNWQRTLDTDAYNREQDALDRAYREQQQAREDQQNRAAILAASGDYSGYAEMLGLGSDATSRLTAQWIAQNPETALNSGMITADQYKSMLGASLMTALMSGKISQKEYEALAGTYSIGGSTAATASSGGTSTSWYDQARNAWEAAGGRNSNVSLADYIKEAHDHPEMLNIGATPTTATTSNNTIGNKLLNNLFKTKE